MGGFWLYLHDRELPLAATVIGTLTFFLGGYLVSMLNVTNNLQASVWTPWVLLFWRRYVDRRSFLYLELPPRWRSPSSCLAEPRRCCS